MTVPASQCYGELGVDDKERFVLRIFPHRGDQAGKRPMICKPIVLQRQAYKILAGGIDIARRHYVEEQQMTANGDGISRSPSECEPPPGHQFEVEWSQDDLARILYQAPRFEPLKKNQKDAIKKAIYNVRRLVTFDKDKKCGLVSDADKTKNYTRQATIRLRLQNAGKP